MLYSKDRYYEFDSITLDDVVTKYQFPKPDFIKMDVQGSEKDILQGATETLERCQHLILELPKPNTVYNLGAPGFDEVYDYVVNLGWTCTAPLFSDNGEFDGDYGFTRNLEMKS